MYLCFGTGTFLTSVGRDFLADDGPPDPEGSSTSIEEGISFSRKEETIREGLITISHNVQSGWNPTKEERLRIHVLPFALFM